QPDPKGVPARVETIEGTTPVRGKGAFRAKVVQANFPYGPANQFKLIDTVPEVPAVLEVKKPQCCPRVGHRTDQQMLKRLSFTLGGSCVIHFPLSSGRVAQPVNIGWGWRVFRPASAVLKSVLLKIGR